PANHFANHAIQFFGARGFFDGYASDPDGTLAERTAAMWINRVARLVEPSLIAAAPAHATASAHPIARTPADDAPLTRGKFATWLAALGDVLDAWHAPPALTFAAAV